MICFYLSMISSCGWPLMDDVLVWSLVKCGKHQHIDVRDWKKKSKEIVSHLNTHNCVEYCYSSFLIITLLLRNFLTFILVNWLSGSSQSTFVAVANYTCSLIWPGFVICWINQGWDTIFGGLLVGGLGMSNFIIYSFKSVMASFEVFNLLHLIIPLLSSIHNC